MPITSGWKDNIDGIVYPEDYCKWEDLGDGANHYHTITNINSTVINSNGLNFGEESTSYIKIDYTNSLKLHGRSGFTIEFAIKINSDSTSTTNFQTGNEGIIVAQGEGRALALLNWAVLVDANNQVEFRYKTGVGSNSITSAAVKIFNDQIEKFKITVDGTEIKMYKNDVLVVTSNINSAGILTSTDDLVIGGNSTGNLQLFNAEISGLRLRKDVYSGDTLETSDQLYLIEAARETASDNSITNVSDNWDVDTLIYLPFSSNANLLPRQLKKIPATWGDWTRWFVAPSMYIDATTSTINFLTSHKGFKKAQIQTTDGFLYPYNAGVTATGANQNLPYWGGQLNYGSTIHGQGGDINFVATPSLTKFFPTEVTNNEGRVTETNTLNLQIKVPSKGYMPDEEKTESMAMLDTSKVDSTSAKAQYNQGFRPRGIKRGSIRHSAEYIQETQIRNSQDDAHMMGMPYYEFNTNIEGGIYIAGLDSINASTTGIYDYDFRYNEKVVHINYFDSNSIGQAQVKCRDNHNLTTGDMVYVRPGQYILSSGGAQGENSSYLKRHSLSNSRNYMNLTGKKYVQVVDDTTVILFHDSARTNPVYIDGYGQNFRFGYLQKHSTFHGTQIQQRGRRIFNYSKPFTSFYYVQGDNNATVLDHTSVASGDDLNQSLSDIVQPTDTTRPLLNIPGKSAWLYRGDFGSISNLTKFTNAAGSASDPIIINSKSGGFVSASIGEEGAPVYIDLDSKFTGTLKFTVTNIETADSTTPTDIKYQFITNGDGPTTAQPFNSSINGWGSQFYDTNLTVNTASAGSTVSIPLNEAAGLGEHYNNEILYSIALKIWIPDVVHASTSDNTKATYTIWFENNAEATADGAPVKLFYGGGIQPGRTIYGNIPGISLSNFGSFSYNLFRSNHYVHYSVDENRGNPAPQVEITLRGIPLVGYTGTGETVVGDEYSLMYGDGSYELPYIQEDATSPTPYRKGIAPWVEQATQVAGYYRLYKGKKYKCLTSHTSSKLFETDFDSGFWELA